MFTFCCSAISLYQYQLIFSLLSFQFLPWFQVQEDFLSQSLLDRRFVLPFLVQRRSPRKDQGHCPFSMRFLEMLSSPWLQPSIV